MNAIQLPPPRAQIQFAIALQHWRHLCLREALFEAVGRLDIAELDRQLLRFAPASALATLARQGLRGELMFATPLLLNANPRLLAYYRLLLGYSQKEFYGRGVGTGGFRSMEEKGRIGGKVGEEGLAALASAMGEAAGLLLEGVQSLPLSRELFHEWTLLTLGPQLRGAANNQFGAEGIDQVFAIIRRIVAHAVAEEKPNALRVNSATGRPFLIEFAPDPDIVIREIMDPDHFRNVVAIEIKSGGDVSNIHNRLGEAEKSHQKARNRGFTECWTIFNVDRLDRSKAKDESPSTDRFYALPNLALLQGEEFDDFKRRLLSLTAIPAPPASSQAG